MMLWLTYWLWVQIGSNRAHYLTYYLHCTPDIKYTSGVVHVHTLELNIIGTKVYRYWLTSNQHFVCAPYFDYPNVLKWICVVVGTGNFISGNMELVRTGTKSRVWKCRLCSYSAGEALVALHINEQHLQ